MGIITLQDSFIDMMVKMAEGNPGAITVLTRILEESPIIDPDSADSKVLKFGIIPILALDDMGIRGSGLWILYKDICGMNLVKLIALIRSVQFGFLDAKVLVELSQDRPRTKRTKGFDPTPYVATVKAELPNFNDSYRNEKPDVDSIQT